MNRLVISAMLAATVLPAATISFTYLGQVSPLSIQRSLNSGTNWTTLNVGQMRVTVSGTTGFSGYVPSSFYTFCIEPQQSVSNNTSYTYDIDPLELAPTNVPGGMGAIKADLLRELYGRYYTSFFTVIPTVTAAALQVATWEIIRETSGTYSVTTGVVQFQSTANPSVLTEATAMLSSLDGTGPLLANLYSIRGPSNQDLAFHAVPEPTTSALMGGALLMAGAWRRRRVPPPQ